MIAGSKLPRRRFVRSFAFLTATSALASTNWVASVLARLRTQSEFEGGLLRLKISDFPLLQKELGSVRLGTTPIGPNHMPAGLFYPVIITRGPDAQFYALDAACTHEGCTVPTLDPGSRLMQCPCHGSQYNIDGSLRRGPAGFPLRQFKVQFDGVNVLTVALPDVSFSLEAVRVQPGLGRVRLDFIAFEQIEYEIYFRPNLAAEWSGPVPFSLTAEGPLDHTVIVGAANIPNVFLDALAANGIYAVAMRMKPV